MASLMILIFEAFNLIWDDYFYRSPFDGLRANLKNEIALKKGNTYDLLIFGGCYSIKGFIPKVIDKETGLTSFNFSTYDLHSIFSQQLILKNYLRRNSKIPQYVVLSYGPYNAFNVGKTLSEENLYFFYDINNGNFIEFLREFGLGRTLSLFIPSLKHQYFYELFIRMRQLPRLTPKEKVDDFIKLTYDSGGYDPTNNQNVYDGEIDLDVLQMILDVPPFFKKYITKFLNMAIENNIKVIFVIQTRPKVWHDVELKSGKLKVFKEYMEMLKREYPEMVVLDAQEDLDNSDLYADFFHVNEKGAIALSKLLSEKINQFK